VIDAKQIKNPSSAAHTVRATTENYWRA
jgi:hypothetical protein